MTHRKLLNFAVSGCRQHRRINLSGNFAEHYMKHCARKRPGGALHRAIGSAEVSLRGEIGAEHRAYIFLSHDAKMSPSFPDSVCR